MGTEPWRSPLVDDIDLRRLKAEDDMRKAKDDEDAAIARRTSINNTIVVAFVVMGIALVAWCILVSMPPAM